MFESRRAYRETTNIFITTIVADNAYDASLSVPSANFTATGQQGATPTYSRWFWKPCDLTNYDRKYRKSVKDARYACFRHFLSKRMTTWDFMQLFPDLPRAPMSVLHLPSLILWPSRPAKF